MVEKKAVEVRAKVAHIQPGTHQYREAGAQFTHVGELYKHVEEVEAVEAEPDAEEESAGTPRPRSGRRRKPQASERGGEE